MTYERSTKNTHRFLEISQPARIGTLYIQKWCLKDVPRKIRVKIEVVE